MQYIFLHKTAKFRNVEKLVIVLYLV